MNENYMSDDNEPQPSGNSQEDSKGSETSTALLPIAFFQGKDLKPGSVCSVKIEKVEDDQAEVSYVPHDQEEAGEEAPPESSQGGAEVPESMMG